MSFNFDMFTIKFFYSHAVTQQPTTKNSQEYKQQCNPIQFVTKTKIELKYLLSSEHMQESRL